MKNTLKSRTDFATGRKGRWIKTDYFSLVVSKPSGDGVFRSGITTGAKVGNAVQRNRLRRVARSVLADRVREANGDVMGNVAIVFHAGAANFYEGDDRGTLANDLRKALSKADTRFKKN